MERHELTELLLDHQWLGPSTSNYKGAKNPRCLCGWKPSHGSKDKFREHAEHVTDVIFKKELNI